MNQKAHQLRWALFFGCSSELNSDLALDYSRMGYSGSQDINSFLQALGEKIYPKQFVLSNQPSSFFTKLEGNGSVNYQPLRIGGSTVSPYTTTVKSNNVDLTYYSTIVASNSSSNANPLFSLYQGNTKITDYSVPLGTTRTFDISSYTGEYNFRIGTNSYDGSVLSWSITLSN